ncbi:MAG: hypothetical protein KIT09_23875 [Bryobacteraceae bacterium]|nr:hypothetical protein [Bryobacteraceae bacterium]
MRRAALALAAFLCAAGCGYRVAGRGDLVPREIHAIAIPAFGNATTRYTLTQRLPQAIGREFISRTRYAIVADPEDADAVLEGSVINYFSYPTVFDPATGRAAGVQLILVLDIRLRNRRSGALVFERAGMQVQNRYEISADQAAYFEESDAALERASRDAARTVVSAILENF